MNQQGLTEITVNIVDVGVSHTSIEQFDVSYVEPDTKLRIQLKEIRLEYSLSDLLKGSAENLLIDSAILTLDHRPNPQATTSATLPNIDQLLAAFKAIDASAFPINEVTLADMSVVHNLASASVGAFDSIQLRAHVSKLENRMSTKMYSANQQAFHWTNDEKNGWNLKFFDVSVPSLEPKKSDKNKAVFMATLRKVDESLVFSADIESSLAQRLFSLPQRLDKPVGISKVTLTGAVKGVNGTPGLVVSSTTQVSDLEYQNNRIETLSVKLDGHITQELLKREQSQTPSKFNIKFNSSVSFANSVLTDWQADKFTLSANGDISLAEGLTKITFSDLLLDVGKLRRANEMELSEVSFVGAASIAIGAEQWQVEFNESWKMASQYARLGDTVLSQGLSIRSSQSTHLNGTLNSKSPLPSDAKNEGPQVSLRESTSLKIEVPKVEDANMPFAIRPSVISLQMDKARSLQGQLAASGSLVIPQLTIVDDSTNWQLANFKQFFELKNEVFNSRGSVDNIERDLHIDTTSKHDLKRQRGETQFSLKAIKFKDSHRLDKLTSPLVLPAKLVAGELNLLAYARWALKRDVWQTTVDIDAELIDLGGVYDEVYFSGLNAKSSLQIYPEVLNRKAQRLTIAHVDAGVANTNTVVEFTVMPSKFGDLPIVDLLHAQTQLLQGNMSLVPRAYDLNRARHTLQVVMENIDLSELVRVQQLDDIQATGLITGELPIVLDNGKIRIDNGQLQAIAPGGTLRYQADAAALKTNKYAETVMLALRNFNYDALRADTYYEPDGTLLLKLKLQGNNPDFEQGRQVNLNINLEQNVLKLFESIRLIEGVSDTLDKRVQDFYQKTASQ